MTAPTILRLTRPYASLDAFLAAEGCCLDLREVLLLDPLPAGAVRGPAAALEPGRPVRFQMTLPDATALLTAEGVVLERLDGEQLRRQRPDAPPAAVALRVRLRRYGSAARAVLEAARARRTPSGVHERVTPPSTPASEAPASGAVPLTSALAPENREALLARLRARRRGA